MTLLKKFPSYENLLRSIQATFRRFPVALLSASLGAMLGVYLIGLNDLTENKTLEKLVMTAALGLPLFIALKFLGEKRSWSNRVTYLVQGAGVILAAVYYLSLISTPTLSQQDAVRFLLLNIALHFLVAFLAYFKGQELTGFWQFNKALFLRFATVTLYAAVMFIGLSLAVLAIDHLFGADVDEKRYFQLWVIMAGIFHPWVFLAGVPVNLSELNTVTEYPKGLKIFSQYILLPLAALYFAILIAYEIKIIVDWNWPKGWVSTMVLTYSATGILSMLLLHPLKDLTENRWVKAFIGRFFWGLIPLVVMLYLAIIQRVADYGITPNRYLVLVMAVGLTVVVIYFVFSKLKDIRIIPIVLCVLASLSAYGPWSAFSVSERSQLGRLEGIMTQCGLLVNGSLEEAAGTIPFEDRKEISGIVDYLNEWHGPHVFSPWIADTILDSIAVRSPHDRPGEIAAALGFSYVPPYTSIEYDQSFSLSRDLKQAYDIAGYDYLIHYNVGGYTAVLDEDLKRVFELDSTTCIVDFDNGHLELHIRLNEHEKIRGVVTLSLAEPLATLGAVGTGLKTLSGDELTFELIGEQFEARVAFNDLSGEKISDSLRITKLNAEIMIREHYAQ